jgi:zinc transporter, ZIP family
VVKKTTGENRNPLSSP